MIKFYILLLSTLLIHLVLVYFKVLPMNFGKILILDCGIGIIFILSLMISYPGIKKSPENFVMRFLIMTTFQLLGMLSLILTLIYKNKSDIFYTGFTGIALFFFFLIIQSIVLVKGINQKKD